MKVDQSFSEKLVLRLIQDKEWRRLIPRIVMATLAFVIFLILLCIMLIFALIEKGAVI